MFSTKLLSELADITAPDGSDARVLLSLKGGSMAHFQLAAGQVSRAVAHRTVDEIWYFLEGLGVMWRRLDDHEETVRVERGSVSPFLWGRVSSSAPSGRACSKPWR